VGTIEAVAISVVAGIWAGVVGWWFRASTVVRECIEGARRAAPIDDARAATSVPRRRRTGWPAITGATGATVAAAIVLGGRGSLWMTPFLVAWASGLVAMALIDEETLVLPSKLMYSYALVVCYLLATEATANNKWRSLERGSICAVAALVLFGLWAFVQPNSLGLGDARLAFLVAFGVGTVSAAGCAVALTSAPAMAAGISILRRRYRGTDRSTPVPLGPYFAVAGIAVVVASAI
jgi:leader peptidase (prepilin peptidase) / N-methyltransferase